MSEAASSSAAAAIPAESGTKVFQKGTAATCAICGSLGHRTERCIAHLMPQLILSMATVKKRRLELLCERWAASATENAPTKGLKVLPSLKEPELIFLRTPNPEALTHHLNSIPWLRRHVRGYFIVPHIARNVEELQAGVSKLLQEQNDAGAAASEKRLDMIFRVQTVPKTLRATLLDPLTAHIELHPHNFTHFLFVVQSYKKFYYGIAPKAVLEVESTDNQLASEPSPSASASESSSAPAPASSPSSQPSSSPASIVWTYQRESDDVHSRAYYKLAEAFVVDEELNSRIVAGSRAIDIGASPGGWSSFLASKGVKVMAIDPGKVVCTSPLVTHVPKLIENATEEIAAFATEGAVADDPASKGLDLIVCDMNVRPQEAAKLINFVCANIPMKPNALLVLTCKETVAGRSKMLAQEATYDLSDYFQHFRSHYLLSNGKERTLIAEFLPLSNEDRQQLIERNRAASEERKRLWDLELAQRREKERLKAEQKAASAPTENVDTNSSLMQE